MRKLAAKNRLELSMGRHLSLLEFNEIRIKLAAVKTVVGKKHPMFSKSESGLSWKIFKECPEYKHVLNVEQKRLQANTNDQKRDFLPTVDGFYGNRFGEEKLKYGPWSGEPTVDEFSDIRPIRPRYSWLSWGEPDSHNQDTFSDEEDSSLPPLYTVKRDEETNIRPYLTRNSVELYGSKIAYVLGRLKALIADPKARIILFSQWGGLFSRLQDALDKHEIEYVICRGNVFMRNKAIKAFNTQKKVQVIMLSLESAASGANLQKASHVIIMDPPAGTKEEADAIESQAIGRAHRQGQKKKLVVIRMVMKDTVEEELLKRKDEITSWRMSTPATVARAAIRFKRPSLKKGGKMEA